ncbi:MAG: alpha-L-fucosidase [Urechidicola sp.]|nr:alpha-L-fucosidase [Urechidicola sp.]
MKLKGMFLALILCGTMSFSQEQFQPTWESLDARETPQWFTNAKFGIFIHWGLYSVPGYSKKGTYAEWYWNALNEDPNTPNEKRKKRNEAITKFHNENYGEDFDYSKFRDGFTTELFNADEWAGIFKRSGAKYVVLTSKHHDGYCLFPSKEASTSFGMPWNSKDSGPKRDLVGELTTAVRKQGVKMGLYYSIWDWYNPYWTKKQQTMMSKGSMSVNTKAKGSKKSKFTEEQMLQAQKGLDKYIDEVMYPQVKQLVNDYQPALLFSDGDWWMDYKKWKTLPLLTWAFNEAPNKEELVINDRWGRVRGKHGSYYTTEYGSGFADGSKPWEENRGIGMSFGINRIENIDDYRTEKELLFMLMDIVSRGGNLLLNIGPNPDGTIPVIMQQRLLEIGDWLAIYGEGIYGTKQWIKDAQWSEGAIPTFSKRDFHGGFPIYEMTINPKEGNAVKEFWFTQKDATVYGFSPEWPKTERILIKDIKPTSKTTVQLMGCDKELPYIKTLQGIEVDLSKIGIRDLKSEYVFGFKISNIN